MIKTYHFLPYKHGRELLVDIGRIETLENFVLDSTRHQLSFYEVLFIERGSGIFSLDENKIPIAPGTVIFTSPGQVRHWAIEEAVSGYTLFFEKDFLYLFFADELFLYRFQYFHQYLRPTAMQMSDIAFGQCIELVFAIAQEFSHLQNDSNHLIRAILYQLLVVLNRFYAAIYKLQNDTHICPDFYRFRSLLEAQYMTRHSVAAYTKMLNISAGHLNKLCKQYSGLSAQQMIHHKLISAIKRQLFSNKSAKEITYEFGFSDPSNFNRFFKKFTGTTPQKYQGHV
ncbi:MAG TPA: helix-turn-helix transcriptional regulator [Chitinophaga sp.]|uniref:AraC family transcriptional regulator n=1 Tax=Chitinophaga sp. TaxID=1869181 RepID=UPI002C8C79BD|nr:helix-turn-helix transcriptional regulator [Chitinophaga sp.]HVI45156.1 helix-turn-helix transcriptional regulator [Chitinophaga sp.]